MRSEVIFCSKDPSYLAGRIKSIRFFAPAISKASAIRRAASAIRRAASEEPRR